MLTACDYPFVIHVYGQGDPHHLFHLVDHHAEGVGDLIAPIAVVLMDILGRDDQRHEVHIGGGWNSVNLYLANGEKLALRARTTAGRYDHLNVHRGSINPLGALEIEIRDAMGVARFHRALAKWAKP